MIVTLVFRSMPGETQVEELRLRINTTDPVDAVARAIAFARTVTSIEFERLTVDEIGTSP